MDMQTYGKKLWTMTLIVKVRWSKMGATKAQDYLQTFVSGGESDQSFKLKLWL
jgi:hypothetical protein